ncbi:unnamed protein product [Rotaria sp. Silwood2]|nr:unnamed protein product [Rotaria sp. Silwood2]CAF4509052.1 unnamed protein product [Rotaria sp. Silwood2]
MVPCFESILSECLPYLCQFVYTMTHQIANQILIKDFVRWPMNVIFYDDKRQIPIVRIGSNPSVLSDVKRYEYMKSVIIIKDNEFTLLNTKFSHACEIISCLLADIKLPFRISKLIFSDQTPSFSINSIIQPSVRHLIVKHCLYDERKMLTLAYQFSRVKYLELLFSLNKSSFINCFNIVFNQDDNIKKKSCYWSELIFFSTKLFHVRTSIISNESQLYNSFIRYTNLKDPKHFFHPHCPFSTLTIWY